MFAICLNVFSVIASALLCQQTLLEGFFLLFLHNRRKPTPNMLLLLFRAAVKR